jgi:hypothetical protein
MKSFHETPTKSCAVGLESKNIKKNKDRTYIPCSVYNFIHYPTSTRRHGNFAGVHTLLRILLSSNSAVIINIITGVSPPHFDFVVYYVMYYNYKQLIK